MIVFSSDTLLKAECPPTKMSLKDYVRPVTTEELDKLRRWIAGGAPAEIEQFLGYREWLRSIGNRHRPKVLVFPSSQTTNHTDCRKPTSVRTQSMRFLLENWKLKV